MEWILEKFPVVIVAFVVLARIIQAVAQSRTARQQHEQESGETAEQRRVREIQERIRRAIASRRGGQPAATPPPVLTPTTMATEDSDPFHDEDQPPVVVAPDPVAVARALRHAELERQAQLAEKMRALAEAKEIARYKSQEAAMEVTLANTPAVVRRHRLDEVIRDRDSLRRAILAREILGPPVGLR